jgi:predicted outer membrane repeat protein
MIPQPKETVMTTRIRPLLLSSLLLLAAATPVRAFDVNSTKDQVDAAIDGVCASAEGLCTLRAAVQEAEATVAPDVINVPAGKYKLKLTGIFENESAAGDLDITQDLTINGAGVGVTIIQGKKDRVFDIFGEPVVAINNLTITKGAIVSKLAFPPEDLDGGGISILFDAVVTLTDVAVVGNKATDDGGGIACGADLVMNRVTVEKNKARDDAGGVYTFVGTSTLTNVTIAKNRAGDQGGAMEVQSFLTCTNCTLSGNKAKTDGGAVHSEDSVLLINATLKGNKGGKGQAGGLQSDVGAQVEIRNTLLDTNKPLNCVGTVVLGGGNLESGASCGLAPAASDVDIELEGLDDNGGSTKTHALKPESPAIDFGVDTDCPATDQRGVARVDVPAVGTGICDSGAFEFVPAP